jgi:hypothetical protein
LAALDAKVVVMTDAELKRIEEELGFSLPMFYKATMVRHPFPAEPMLIDDPQEVIDLNTGGLEMAGVSCAFFVGSDGGERFYFVDAAEPLSGVYSSEVETRHHKMEAESWNKYVARIRHARSQQGLGPAEAGVNWWWPF